MEGKHTKGLWTGHDGRIYIKGGDARNMIATVHHPSSVSCYPKMDGSHQRLKDERDANTALIAAAPDLLEACEATIKDMHDEMCSGCTGEGECSPYEADAYMDDGDPTYCVHKKIYERLRAAIAKAKGEA